MLGGYDKMVMSKGEAAMRAEFKRLLPVMASGGYVPSVGHQTPPGVSLENYRTYVRLLREYCAKAAEGRTGDAGERDLGEQPIAGVLRERGLKAHDLIAASTEQITHKMVSRACKGRRLTPRVQAKIRDALTACAGREYTLGELFTY